MGASGMVMGMSLVATCLWPTAPAGLILIPITFPLWVLTLGYVDVDTYFLKSETSPIGHAAHLGGAAFGAAYYFAYLRGLGGIWQVVVRIVRRR